MIYFKNTGLILCLSISAVSLGCNDDNDDQPGSIVVPDSGAHDSGAHDGSVDGSALDASLLGLDASLDSATADAAVDAGTGPVSYSVTLTKAAEGTAACTSAGTNATGSATVSLDDTGTLVVSVTYSGLSGPVTLAHIHYGAASVADGPVVLPFTPPFTLPITQVLTEADYTPNGNAPATYAAFLTALREGDAYINLHTLACSMGEVRGQIQ